MLKTFYLVAGILIATALPLKIMNVGIIRPHSTIFFDESRCPVQPIENQCKVVGDLSHNLIGDVEITLDDGRVLLVNRNQLRGSLSGGDVTYKGGRWFIGLLMVLSIALGACIAFFPAFSAKPSSKV